MTNNRPTMARPAHTLDAHLAEQIRAFARSARRTRPWLYAASFATAASAILAVVLVKLGVVPEWLGWIIALVLIAIFGTAALRLTIRRAIAGMREVLMLAEAFGLEVRFAPDDEERAHAAARMEPFSAGRDAADGVVWVMRGVIAGRRVALSFWREGSLHLAYASASIARDTGHILLRAEHAGHALARWAGEKEPQFQDAAFDRRWWVRCDHEAAARAALDAPTRPCLMSPALAARRSDSWAIGEGVVVCEGRLIIEGELSEMLLNALELADCLSPPTETA